MAAIFTASDAQQRRHLLTNLADALDAPETVAYVVKDAYEQEDTSLYLFSFYRVGLVDGYDGGREIGLKEAFDHFYGAGARHVAARTSARQQRRKRTKR